MEILDRLYVLFGGKTHIVDSIAFSIACIFIALILIAGDWCIYTIRQKKSFLGLEYEKLNKNQFAYVLGAGIVGFLGILANILNNNIQTILSVGVGWPYILIQIVKSHESEIPEQKTSEEE